MRRNLALLVLLACAAASAGCAGRTTSTTDAVNASATNGNPATNANTSGVANTGGMQTNAESQGVGPNPHGIGGTSKGNSNAYVSGNSNVAPAGVNRNVGATPAQNGNR